jgi:hypothetical protein
MAKDVITRFKLETTQFDSKLRDTAKGLQNIAKQAELGGKDFNNFSQKAIESARALGTVQSGANNTKDRLKDLVGSYNDAAKAYNSLSEAAKQGEFGRAMAQSLDQLQVRIKDTKEELYSLGDAVKGKGGLFGEGGLTGMMQVFGGNMLTKGVEALTSKLTDAWTESIKLAREGEGVRIAFERLNQPGLLDRLKEATHGTVSEVELMKQAIKFENFKLPLEDLATYLAFAQQKAKDTGESVDYMVNSITTGLGRQSKQILDNLGISAAELTKRMNEGADMTKAVADIIREEMAKAGDYVETAADRAAQAAAKATDEMEKFGQQAAPIAEAWGETWNAISIGAMEIANTLLGPVAESIRSLQNLWNNGWEDNIINSPFNIEGKTPKKTGYQGMGSLQRVQAPGGYVEVTDTNTGAVIGGQHFDNLSDTNSINAWRKGLVKTPKTGGSSTKNLPTLEDFWLQMTKNDMKLQDQKAAGDLVKDMPSPYQMMFDEIKKQYLDKQDFDLGKDVSKNWKVDKNGNLTDRPIKSKTDESIAKDINKFTGYAGKMLGGVDGIFSGISQLGIEIPKGLQDMLGGIQAITSIASGIASVLMVIETLQEAQTVSAAIPFFKHGGIVPHAAGGFMVPGNDHADRTPVLVSSGELILNHAQQNALANELQGNGMQNLHLRTEVSGRNLIVVIENDLKARGKGQLATFKG